MYISRRTGLLILFFGTIFFSWYMGLGTLVSLDLLRGHVIALERYVQGHYWLSVVLFYTLFALLLICGLPVLPPFVLIGGYLFSLIPAVCFSLMSCIAGTAISFLLVRTVMRETISVRYNQQLSQFIKAMRGPNAAYYLLGMQFVTVVPFFIITIVAALGDVAFSTFIWTTAVGSIPILFFYAIAGRQLQHIHSARDIFSPSVIIIFGLLILLMIIPMLYKRYKKA